MFSKFPKLVNYTLLGLVTLAILAGIMHYATKLGFGTDEMPPKETSTLLAECAVGKMTFKMKRAEVEKQHKYIMAKIQGGNATYIPPAKNKVFVTLIKSCLNKDKTQDYARNLAANRLAVLLDYDDEYQRIQIPFKREQDRVRTSRSK